MNSIYEIIGQNFPPIFINDGKRSIIPKLILEKCQKQISKLNSISEKLGDGMATNPPLGIQEVYHKFINCIQSNREFSTDFDKRELRTLTFALNCKGYENDSIFENLIYLNRCLALLNGSWRDSYISGLLGCYLTNWDNDNNKSFTTLSNFLLPKIEAYSGSRAIFQEIKNNLNYFNERNGDLTLGANLAISKRSILDATKFLSLPDQWITYRYFSGVINAYLEKSKNRIEDIIDDVSIILEKHSNSIKATRINKLIVSKIICFSIESSEILQNKVKDVAFRLVGDPGIPSLWRPHENFNREEIEYINKARYILNEWITRQFINVFFEKCINDRRRKMFWLKFSKKITSFKVFGPSHLRRILKRDNRISEYVDGRFYAVHSSGDVSAFMFLLGEHKMIEFSNPGYAFYAYKANSSSAPSFDPKYVSSVDDFRDGKMPTLVLRSGNHLHSYSNEGRLEHRDGGMTWEEVFLEWIKNKARINV
jgi:hypothetical protein